MQSAQTLPPLRVISNEWVVVPVPKWSFDMHALSIMGLVSLLIATTIYLQAPGESFETLSAIPLWKLVLALLVYIPVHELCHGVAHPRFGLTNQTHLGMAIHKGYAFCIFDGPSTKGRALVTLMLPFLLLTVLPFVLAYQGVRLEFWMAVALLNAAGACGDFVIAWFLITRVPQGAQVGYHHGKTMYKPA